MEYRNGEESKEQANRNDESKIETDRSYYPCGNESEESEYKNIHGQLKDGTAATKPSDVRNGDLVSLLLAATPPYLYNIPLVPQTFFFSEMLKSFVQAKTERQNLKAQQSHNRRQRKRSWREMTPPKTAPCEAKDKPLELTTVKQLDEKQKSFEKIPNKKFQGDIGEKKYQNSKLGSSNFSVEKLANSSITSGPETANGNSSGDLVPPTPPMWYPLLYPPHHPPYGIDPLHFFIDLRVSAHFWDRKLTADKINSETSLIGSPLYPWKTEGPRHLIRPVGRPRCNSAFSVPTERKSSLFFKNETKKNYNNVHYVVSSLKAIYESLDNNRREKKETKSDATKEEESKNKKCKDIRALIGLELVVDYFKRESDGDDVKSNLNNSEKNPELQTVSVE